MNREKLISLVTQAQSGDSQALDALFTEFYNDVYYFALKTVKDSDTACDITQETFLEIIRTIGNLKEPAAFVTWMKQITYHQCTRYFNKKKDELVEEDEDGNTIFDSLADESEGSIPSEVLEKEEFRQTILAMIDKLTEEQRSAVMMYYFDELTVGQIAQIQGVSEGTVKSRLNYARKAVRKSVEDYEKKTGIKLHSFAFLPLFLLFFGKELMPEAKAAEIHTAVTASANATMAGAVGAASATAATASTSVGVLVQLPLVGKVIAGILAIAVVVGLGPLVTNPKTEPNQDNPQQSISGENENGKPVVENNTPSETYLVDEVVNVTSLTVLHRNEEGLITSFDHGYKKEYLCEYDANGNLLKISKFGYNKHGDGIRRYYDKPDDVWTFTYDANGNLVEYVHKGSEPWTYQYDENGRLTAIRLYPDKDVEVQYTYDAQGRVTAKKTRNTKNFEEEHLFEYDTDGKLTQYHRINYARGEVSSETYYTYSYDSGVVTSFEMKTHFSGNTNEQTVTCKYDDNGCMIEQEINGITKMYEIKYVPMNLTAEQAERAQQNTEFILTFTNHRITPNSIHVEWLK